MPGGGALEKPWPLAAGQNLTHRLGSGSLMLSVHRFPSSLGSSHLPDLLQVLGIQDEIKGSRDSRETQGGRETGLGGALLVPGAISLTRAGLSPDRSR